MKQSSIIILFTVLMSMVSIKASAYDIEVKNSDGVTIYYCWINNKTELAISYKGEHSRIGNSYSGNVVIPEFVEYEGNTYIVTEIGSNAFYNCSDLTSISIPKTITRIESYAFYGCSRLKSVHISDLAAWCVTTFDCNNSGKGIYAQYSNPLSSTCHLYLNGKEIKDLVIPESVTRISNAAFSGYSFLTSVTIPQNVTSIGDIAFKGCSGLTSITISNSVTYIGNGAFQNCSGLTSIIIPKSVISIGNHAFEGCSNLVSATIEEGVKTIKEDAFHECNNLNTLIIPNSVSFIGLNAFHGTAWYNNQSDGVVYAGNNVYIYKGTMPQNTEIVLREGTISIGECAFSRCSGLKSITIPQSLTHIYFDAFSGCI